MSTYNEIIKLESIAGGSPFYVVDRLRFESNFDDLTEAFSSRYYPFILAYSYKTNYIPYLCDIIRQEGGWAEVVSRMEYDLALKVGQTPDKIIFNGPVKTADDIAFALQQGSLVNIDCRAELDLVKSFANAHPDKEIEVGLRINIALSDDAGQSHIQNSLKVGRFGFTPASIEHIKKELSQARNVKIIGLHGHTSTTDRSKWCFKVIARTLCKIAADVFPESVQYINVGGGFFGRMHPGMPFKNTPAFEDYADVICNVLNEHAWSRAKKPTLVIEPGVAMVADSISFVTKVVSVKIIAEQIFVTVDGSAFHAKPTFHTLNMPHRVIVKDENRPDRQFTVVGSTCMEKDILLNDIAAPLPLPGDYIQINNVGAYTLVMSPPFIHPAPAIIADEGGGQYKRVRSRQTLDEVFSNYEF
jgi:diaminopimelate decarboxylase